MSQLTLKVVMVFIYEDVVSPHSTCTLLLLDPRTKVLLPDACSPFSNIHLFAQASLVPLGSIHFSQDT